MWSGRNSSTRSAGEWRVTGRDGDRLRPTRRSRPSRALSRRAEGKQDCLVIDVMGNQPSTTSQVVLPHVVGVSKAESGNEEEAERSRTTDRILKALLGADIESGLSLLDPIGQSHYRWVAYRHGYFARVTRDITAIIERDPEGSGLYRSRLYTREYEQDGQESEFRWIAQEFLPLSQC